MSEHTISHSCSPAGLASTTAVRLGPKHTGQLSKLNDTQLASCTARKDRLIQALALWTRQIQVKSHRTEAPFLWRRALPYETPSSLPFRRAGKGGAVDLRIALQIGKLNGFTTLYHPRLGHLIPRVETGKEDTDKVVTVFMAYSRLLSIAYTAHNLPPSPTSFVLRAPKRHNCSPKRRINLGEKPRHPRHSNVGADVARILKLGTAIHV